MFTAPPRKLPFPLDNALVVESDGISGDVPCELPVFPEDSDEKVTVFFRLSLNEFVALASAIDVGRDIAYGEQSDKLWLLWSMAYMCASFCGEMALCLDDDNPAVIQAIADAINRSTLIQQAIIQQITNYGSGVPGQPLTEPQAQIDTLPMNVKIGEICDLDALWGACLYLTQSANRAIEDFFQQIETLTNPIERGQLAATAVPAVGNYIALVPALVDQIASELSEGYTAAYTETLEQQIACAIFCVARGGCELSIDQIIDVFAAELGELDISDFAVVMTLLTTGVLVGNQIVYAGFLLYFAAMKFGQQFGGVLGLRPLTDLMGLGADYLSSDNWETLCECPTFWEHTIDFTLSTGGFEAFVNESVPRAQWVDGLGWARGGTGDAAQQANIQIQRLGMAAFNIQTMEITCTEAPTLGYQFRMNDVSGGAYSSGIVGSGLTTHTITLDNSGSGMWLNAADNDGENMTGYITTLHMTGSGDNPFL